MARQPWGTSAQSACRWAFAALASADGVPSMLGELVTKGSSKAQRELTRLELRAQAAAIRGAVERLDSAEAVAYLIALYLPKPMLEKQPGGGVEYVDRFPDVRQRHFHAIAWWLLGQQGTGQHRIRGYQEIVAQYMLKSSHEHGPTRGITSLDRIRVLMKMDMNRVGEVRKKCEDALKDLDKRAHTLIDNRLVEMRLLDDEYAA